MNNELKLCPFCGGIAKMNINYGDYGYISSVYSVKCQECGAQIKITSNGRKDMFKTVIKTWNRRVE